MIICPEVYCSCRNLCNVTFYMRFTIPKAHLFIKSAFISIKRDIQIICDLLSFFLCLIINCKRKQKPLVCSTSFSFLHLTCSVTSIRKSELLFSTIAPVSVSTIFHNLSCGIRKKATFILKNHTRYFNKKLFLN